ncbi:Hypothetical protein SMAX5B_013592 [Scophthalmus maximus]|uniref:Uncharacterized protein n=1 Tax=Scophthalmus maximus TaxID=52904 RepID=A0A2U9BF75_SCOMX|nr:Hypothetical protein SMAX5B_013592 [Scophthalmus maximus]
MPLDNRIVKEAWTRDRNQEDEGSTSALQHHFQLTPEMGSTDAFPDLTYTVNCTRCEGKKYRQNVL